ncbi:gustatory receptor for sugar taste 64f-like [Zerene cesonia]|uniref:gustatory receptor for sugar taste 64f-like n=1 Tax=Zerene cesonia TaxID=33412 RepID=UPI0018E56569|nr:gustatory receptor for sugar taste 64f-like [Zerene cesonia]
MSIKPFSIEVKDKTKEKSHHFALYKEFEKINLKQIEKDSNNGTQFTRLARMKKQFLNLINTKVLHKDNLNFKDNFKNQLLAFQGATRLLIIAGQCIGLNPFLGVLENDVSKIRFSAISFRHFYSLLICTIQIIGSVFSFVNLTKNGVSVTNLAYFNFYCTTCVTSILFLILARRWQMLNKEVSLSRLDEYTDPYIRLKCVTAVVIILSLGLAEHILSAISNFTLLMHCKDNIDNLLRDYVKDHFPWMFELNRTEYNVVLGIFFMFINVVNAMNWNYSHVFIICISLYLTSLIEQVNKKLISAEGQYLPSSFWKALREDYNRATRLVKTFDDYINSLILVGATRLVKTFDDYINSLILVGFASNLFFVCLRIYYVLAFRPFNGYEHVVYFAFSLAFVLSRSLAVSLIASKVHVASLEAAPTLYSVPSSVYCIEVQRFIEQVHGDTVALTGMNFFYVTRQLVLSVAGTIITYELVMLQFNIDSPGTDGVDN